MDGRRGLRVSALDRLVEIVARARDRQPDAPVVFVSAHLLRNVGIETIEERLGGAVKVRAAPGWDQ